MSTAEAPAAGATSRDGYDRRRELQVFDDTKAGVKGLVDAGITAIPAIFLHPPDPLRDPATSFRSSIDDDAAAIPVVDLSGARREEMVARVKQAAETVGFFQVVNHGVPAELMAAVLAGARRFHEGPAEAKRRLYSRDITHKERDAGVRRRGEESGVAGVRAAVGGARDAQRPPARAGLRAEPQHGVPVLPAVPGAAPQYLTLGTIRHTDPAFLTVLLQDGIGGLQVLLGGGHHWVDVPPRPGALIVNIGDFLQLLSNDRFRSVEHRVVVNRSRDTARVSVPCFFNADVESSTTLYGPITDGSNDPPLYGSVTVQEFMSRFYSEGLEGRALDHFRLQR